MKKPKGICPFSELEVIGTMPTLTKIFAEATSSEDRSHRITIENGRKFAAGLTQEGIALGNISTNGKSDQGFSEIEVTGVMQTMARIFAQATNSEDRSHKVRPEHGRKFSEALRREGLALGNLKK